MYTFEILTPCSSTSYIRPTNRLPRPQRQPASVMPMPREQKLFQTKGLDVQMQGPLEQGQSTTGCLPTSLFLHMQCEQTLLHLAIVCLFQLRNGAPAGPPLKLKTRMRPPWDILDVCSPHCHPMDWPAEKERIDPGLTFLC